MSSPRPGNPVRRYGAWARKTGRALLDKGNAAIGWIKASRFGTLMTRLNAADFINSSFQPRAENLAGVLPNAQNNPAVERRRNDAEEPSVECAYAARVA